MLTEVVHTLVLQTHTVQHATGRFCHTGVVITFTRMQSRSFDDDTANAIQWYKISKFKAIAKRTGGSHDWILQREASYAYI